MPDVPAAPEAAQAGAPASLADSLEPEEYYAAAPAKPRLWLHLLLFLLTVLTTLMVGAELQANFLQGLTVMESDFFLPVLWIFEHPQRLLLGIPFCLTLMLILFAHEMGHYIYCRKHKVDATLPFFIPSPFFIGTFGAVIRIRAPIPNRRILFDIGIAGPIAGMLVAIPAAVIGTVLSKHLGTKPDEALATPLFIHDIVALVRHGVAQPAMEHLLPHPILIAAWIGGLVTVLNLLPGGQLDGGHILYALIPRWHKAITTGVALGFLGMGFFFWPGWILWGAVLLYLRQHPEIPETLSLGKTRSMLALVALLLFVGTFMFRPFPSPPDSLSIADTIDAYIAHHMKH